MNPETTSVVSGSN